MISMLAALLVFVRTTSAPPPLQAQSNAPASSAHSLKDLVHFEATGLSLIRPHERGKIPVVFVHGLWASPWSWCPMIKALEADPVIDQTFQFWTFGYSTGDPIPFSAHLLRRDLDEVRQKLDPAKTDTGIRPDGDHRP